MDRGGSGRENIWAKFQLLGNREHTNMTVSKSNSKCFWQQDIPKQQDCCRALSANAYTILLQSYPCISCSSVCQPDPRTIANQGAHTNLLVSGMLESRPWGSWRPLLPQGAPSFSPFSWAAGLPACPGSEPGPGAGVPLRGVPFPSVVSWAPSA